MAGENKIYPFAEDAESPYIETDAEYEADPDRVSGWEPGVVEQPFLNKLHKQAVTPAAGLSQFVADNQDEDVTDGLTPEEYATLLANAIQVFNGDTAVTQPKFDNTTKIATDEFVQNALGNFSGVYALTTNTVLTGTQCGMAGLIGANSLTVSLPKTADVPDGVVITLVGNGFGDTTINRQDADVIALGLNVGALSYITLLPQDTIQLIKSGGVWVSYNGSAYLQGASSFQHSNVGNGYMKFPGGLIFQWGAVTSVGSIYNLPIAFPNGFLNGSISVNQVINASGVPINPIVRMQIKSLNNSQIQINYSDDASEFTTGYIYYFVIGH